MSGIITTPVVNIKDHVEMLKKVVRRKISQTTIISPKNPNTYRKSSQNVNRFFDNKELVNDENQDKKNKQVVVCMKLEMDLGNKFIPTREYEKRMVEKALKEKSLKEPKTN